MGMRTLITAASPGLGLGTTRARARSARGHPCHDLDMAINPSNGGINFRYIGGTNIAHATANAELMRIGVFYHPNVHQSIVRSVANTAMPTRPFLNRVPAACWQAAKPPSLPALQSSCLARQVILIYENRHSAPTEPS